MYLFESECLAITGLQEHSLPWLENHGIFPKRVTQTNGDPAWIAVTEWFKRKNYILPSIGGK